jgi:hypothetical protein
MLARMVRMVSPSDSRQQYAGSAEASAGCENVTFPVRCKSVAIANRYRLGTPDGYVDSLVIFRGGV